MRENEIEKREKYTFDLFGSRDDSNVELVLLFFRKVLSVLS